MSWKRDLSPILVTGAHRTGTTWVGKTLAQAPGAAYIHEPFNLKQRPGICSAPVDKWYPYVCQENSQQFYDSVRSTLEFRYDIDAELSVLKTSYDFGRMVRDSVKTAYLRYLVRPRPLVKDPFALFSAEWYFNKFNAEIVVLVRHPAAYVSSILKKGWDFPFEHWLAQDALMQEHLSPFKPEIERYANTSPPLIDQAILLWKATHHVVDKYCTEYPSWLIVRYEDICRDPLDKFISIFDALELEWTSRVANFIHNTTNRRNPVDPEASSVLNVSRDSEAATEVWKRRLSQEQIQYICEATANVSCHFYDAT